MNYKQRIAYARNKSNERLKVDSPRSLLGLSTEHMYLPRNDKFEGYSQFPRPKLPPEAQQDVGSLKAFDSFISRRPKGEIYRGEVDSATIPVQELIKMKKRKKEQKQMMSKQT